jgi:pimeloyl-ACP methyl ester carboxylesterase
MHLCPSVKEDAMLPLILVPGLACDAALWRPLDLGATQRPARVADTSVASTISQAARMILASAPDRFALAGLSMGGYIALEILRQAPHRVERLALLDTNAHDDPDTARQRRESQIERALSGDFAGVIDMIVPALLHPDHRARPDIAGTATAMAHRLGATAFVRQQRAIMARRDQGDLLSTIRCPVLILCGADDQLTPPIVHEAMAQDIPGARLEIIPDCGHLATLEQPAAVAAAMRHWLDG